MKITTIPSFRNQTLNVLDQQQITFDHTGSCEVDSKLGQILVEKYPEFIFSGVKKQEKEKTVEKEVTQELVNKLNEEIYDLNKQIEEIKESKKSVEADLEGWKSKVAEIVVRAEKAEDSYTKLKESHDHQVQELELKITLMNSTATELRKLCEDSSYDKKEWELLSKEKLIEYILNK